MLSIDADAHVIETEKTWDYLEVSDRRYRPVAIAVDMPSGKTQNFSIVGGRLIGGRDNIGKDTSKESREMANIDSRLKPYLVHDLNLRFPKLEGKQARPDVRSGSNQLFVACQTDAFPTFLNTRVKTLS